MKIFVAGASGVIGRALLPMLVEEGHEVVGMTHREVNGAAIRMLGATPVVTDALDRAAIRTALLDVRPDVVIHQLTSLREYNVADNAKMRIEGTRNLVDAAIAAGVTHMIAQSISWAYEPGVEPAGEEVSLDTEAPSPRSTTIEGVLALEKAVADLPHYTLLRYGTLYGPGTWYDPQGRVADLVRRGDMAATDGVSSFVHVEDAARAAFQALKWPSGTYNIVDDEPAPSRIWLPLYAAALGAPTPHVQFGSQRGERGASNAKARALGFQPKFSSWREGFQHLTEL